MDPAATSWTLHRLTEEQPFGLATLAGGGLASLGPLSEMSGRQGLWSGDRGVGGGNTMVKATGRGNCEHGMGGDKDEAVMGKEGSQLSSETRLETVKSRTVTIYIYNTPTVKSMELSYVAVWGRLAFWGRFTKPDPDSTNGTGKAKSADRGQRS
ncbi:hypothetical protein V490_07953 [Pseudogymnoascus sp. VKM F-3557]|nr:hypothetical protein V490_07953 [Pseudogymnoascus sp. VKM F-3557]